MFAFSVSPASPAVADVHPANAVSDPAITPPINAAVDTLIREMKLAGAVTLVAKGGKIRHLQAHGVRSLRSNEPMAVDSIFRVHSMTKAIVSAAALQQLELGNCRLEDPISKYLPAFKKLTVMTEDGTVKTATKAITVEDLFRHTSGLAYGVTAPPPVAKLHSNPKLSTGDLDEFCDVVATIPLLHEPGGGWTYGVSTDILGRLIEIWSDQKLDAYLKVNFFDPLGMKDTGFWIEGESRPSRFAGLHNSGPGGVKPAGDLPGKNYRSKPKRLSGGGGVVSTAGDYVRFLQMIADGGTFRDHTFLKPETVALMTTDRLPESIPNIAIDQRRNNVGFGLGFSVVTGKSTGWDEDAKIGEYGWGGAASCHYWVSPSDDNLIVITLEQTIPYNWNLERTLKPLIYEAISNEPKPPEPDAKRRR